MSSLIGQSLGRYHILEQLGEGGMATVYKAYDTRLETDVAVKVIRTENILPSTLERSLKRFEREAKALARLTHPNIVKVTDYGEYESKPYLVMPYLPGGTLKQKLGKPIPWQEAARLLIPIAEALDFAHSQNMIHRDVKPSNILLTQRGQPMLTDFGIAKILDLEETQDLTGTGMGIGTPEYMAPEQWTGKTSPQSDQYALGVVLYEMLTGRKPYSADTPAAILLKQATEPLPRPSQYAREMPEKVEKMLLKTLAKNPADRYASMGEFASALESVLSGIAAPTRQQPARPRERTLDTQATINQMEGSTIKEAPVPRPTQAVPPSTSSSLIRYWPIGLVGILVVCALSIGLFAALFQLPRAIATPETPAPVFTPPPIVTEAPVATEVPVVGKTAIVGFTASLTGKLNIESTRQNNGFQLWMDQVNAAGGLALADGSVVKFTAKFYDDESNKDRVQELYTKLITDDNADFLISPYSSDLADASAIIAEQYGKIMITTGASSDSTYQKGYTMVYQAYTPASHYLTGALDLLASQDPAAKNIAIVYENTKFSVSVIEALKAYAEGLGYHVVLYEGYDAGTTDFTQIVNKIQTVAPDAIMGGGHFPDGQQFAKALFDKGVTAKFITLLVAPPEPTFAEIGDAAFGIVGPSQWEPLATFTPNCGPTGTEFVNTYKAAYGDEPSYHAAGGYVAGLILQKAIETAGSLDTQAIKTALDGMDIMTFFGHIKFDTSAENHGLQIGHSMVYIQWQRDYSSSALVKQVVWPTEGATSDPVYPIK